MLAIFVSPTSPKTLRINMKNPHPNILQPTKSYTIRYPQLVAASEEQEKVFWPSTEVTVEKDIHDLTAVLTDSELHGVTTGLKLFTKYEMEIGENFWTGFIMKHFPRPETQRIGALFGAMELAVHAPFYNKISEAMGLDTDEFYTSYVDDPVLEGRMRWLENLLSGSASDPLGKYRIVAVASIVEGAILYASFAFFRHFQAEGKNKLANLNAGIDFSVRDENIHSMTGAYLAKTLAEEAGFTKDEYANLERSIRVACSHIRCHEHAIVDKLFQRGPIGGITAESLKDFVDHRINLCLKQLDLTPIYAEDDNNPISRWFYKGIQLSRFNDIFQKQGSEYNRDWPEQEFIWQ